MIIIAHCERKLVNLTLLCDVGQRNKKCGVYPDWLTEEHCYSRLRTLFSMQARVEIYEWKKTKSSYKL